MKVLFPIVLISLLNLNHTAFSQPDTIEACIRKSIVYLYEQQVKQNTFPNEFVGEWACYAENRRNSVLLGAKNDRWKDSNCFVTASIHNILAEVYLRHPEYNLIPDMLNSSIHNILRFQEGETFNFWHSYPCISNGDTTYIRRSNGHIYNHPMLVNLFNIVDDADDTAAGLRAMALYNKVCNTSGLTGCTLQLPDNIDNLFAHYRDVNREHPNIYNVLKEHGVNSGAYLTWFGEEKSKLSFHPGTGSPNLPLGKNDIDCVVNANILMTLSEYGVFQRACDQVINYLEKVILEDRCNNCEVYYPTPFSFHYSIAKVNRNELFLSRESIDLLIEEIVVGQNMNGSWYGFQREECLQSTLLAVNALFYLTTANDREAGKAIEKGISFILSKAKCDNRTCSWPEGLFFSLGGLARDTQLWMSEAYTTALALEALVAYREYIGLEEILVDDSL